MKTWQQLRKEQLEICPTLQGNPLYRFMMLENQIGSISKAISYMECAKIDEERYGKPEDYIPELKIAIAQAFAMLIQLSLQFGFNIGELLNLGNKNLEEFNEKRIPREVKRGRK